jgi:hypothetical protein
LGHEVTYVVKDKANGRQFYAENKVVGIFEILVYNMFVEFGELNCQQISDIPMELTMPLSLRIFYFTPKRHNFLMEYINKPERGASSVSFLDIYLKFDISGQHCM